MCDNPQHVHEVTIACVVGGKEREHAKFVVERRGGSLLNLLNDFGTKLLQAFIRPPVISSTTSIVVAIVSHCKNCGGLCNPPATCTVNLHDGWFPHAGSVLPEVARSVTENFNRIVQLPPVVEVTVVNLTNSGTGGFSQN